jgi:hypothetical protein
MLAQNLCDKEKENFSSTLSRVSNTGFSLGPMLKNLAKIAKILAVLTQNTGNLYKHWIITLIFRKTPFFSKMVIIT